MHPFGSEVIFFHSKQHALSYDSISIKQHALSYDSISIKFNYTKLTPVDTVKYLGMYIDKHLSWNFHIFQFSKNLSRPNGILSKLRHSVPLEVCLQVYYTIFYSHVLYGYNIWGLTTEENLSKIEVLQKKCVPHDIF